MQETKESTKDFTNLSYMLKYVYYPLETVKKELRNNMEQLSRVIQENVHKVSQSAHITLPAVPPGVQDQDLAKNLELCQEFGKAIVSKAVVKIR